MYPCITPKYTYMCPSLLGTVLQSVSVISIRNCEGAMHTYETPPAPPWRLLCCFPATCCFFPTAACCFSATLLFSRHTVVFTVRCSHYVLICNTVTVLYTSHYVRTINSFVLLAISYHWYLLIMFSVPVFYHAI